MPSEVHIPDGLTHDDVTFSAGSRCECGAGLCYTDWTTVEVDEDGEREAVDKDPSEYIRQGSDHKPLRAWICSRLVFDEDLGDEHIARWKMPFALDPEVPDEYVPHDVLPFTFWKVKSEIQPSAGGKTTRPEGRGD